MDSGDFERIDQPNHRVLLPAGWPPPRGYGNGLVAKGTLIFLGGQVGWTRDGRFQLGFVAQARKALENVRELLVEADAKPHDLVRLVWYVTDMTAYTSNLKEVGKAYRELFGYNYPPMTLVQVMRLVEPEAMVEIEATAVIPE